MPPVFSGPEPSAEVEGGKIYTGSCHCRAVTIALKEKPLDDTYTGLVQECMCSICQRVRNPCPVWEGDSSTDRG